MTDDFTVKDSGIREEYPSGMRRDTQDGKPDYTLIDRDGLRRYAQHLTLGAEKYGRDNWRLANSQEELERFRSSAFRHFMQWLNGDRDEDHASAVKFNLDAAEYVQARLNLSAQGVKAADGWCNCMNVLVWHPAGDPVGCHLSVYKDEAANE